MPDNGNKNLGIFAVVFGVIYGALYGIYKLISGAGSINEEQKKLVSSVEQSFGAGLAEKSIIQALFEDARRFFNRELTDSEKEKIISMVTVSKKRFESSGGMVVPNDSTSKK